MTFKLGKLRARPEAFSLKFNDYVDASQLPPLPQVFGHDGLIQSWPMLGNDEFGDCVWAGAAHETMLLTQEAGNETVFTDEDVLSDYSAVTGFDPKNPSTDQGTDVQHAAQYRQATGIVDSVGNRHKIVSYLSLTPGNITDLYLATYLFSCVGIGLQLPQSAMDQAEQNQTWDVVPGSPTVGGHYVPLVGRDASGVLHTVSWGKKQFMTEAFLKAFCDEAWAYVSQENLVNQKSPDGFDYDTLIQDLKALS
jgi:hypothetical protein